MAKEREKTWWEELSEPFPSELVHWRVGSRMQDKKRGMALAYIDARDVFDRLDQVVGPANWQTHIHLGPEGRVACAMEIRDPERDVWITKSDGAGATAIEGEKGGVSDAIKRAAVQFGLGRYLYRLDSPWVELEGEGKRIAKHEYEGLRVYLDSGVKPKSAAPQSRPRATQGAKPESQPTMPSDDPDAVISKADLKLYWKLNFEAVEAVYGKKGSEDHKFEAMDYAVARLGKNHSNQIRKRELVQLPALFKEFIRNRGQAPGGHPDQGSAAPPPPDDADYPGNMAPDDEPF